MKSLTSAEVLKILGAQWKNLSIAEKKAYNDLADERNKEETPTQISACFTCPWCDETFDNKDECKKHAKGHNQRVGDGLNQIVPDTDQDTLKKCQLCNLLLRESALDEDIKSHNVEEESDPVSLSDEEVLLNDEEEVVDEIALEELPENTGNYVSVLPKVSKFLYDVS